MERASDYLICLIGRDTARVYFNEYENGRIALTLMDDQTGEPLSTPTVNLPEIEDLPTDHVLIKDYSENEDIWMPLVTAGIIHHPHKTRTTGPHKVRVMQAKLTDMSMSFIEILKRLKTAEQKRGKDNG